MTTPSLTSFDEHAVQSLANEKLLFRNTAAHFGRQVAVSPANSSMKHLHYARTVLGGETLEVTFETETRETGLICLQGQAEIAVNGAPHQLNRYDAIYIPRRATVRISTTDNADVIECSAPVENDYPLQVVKYEDAAQDDSLVFETGGDAVRRKINVLIGKNVKAGRILAGVTQSQPGNWTSFPPHEHARMLEEVYVFYDMPAPAFGVQFVYTDTQQPEGVFVVREGDCVLMPRGYHPNVGIPGHPINFVWMMAAHREVEDRQYGVVNVQPEFAASGSGLEASRK